MFIQSLVVLVDLTDSVTLTDILFQLYDLADAVKFLHTQSPPITHGALCGVRKSIISVIIFAHHDSSLTILTE